MIQKENIDKTRLPKHIAIIMDGNGRWAKKRGNQRVFGHKNGVKAVRDTVEGAAELGLKYLTLYAFSTENWKRPRTEIDALMSLLVATIHKETKTLMDNDVRLLAIGDLETLPKNVATQLSKTIELTSQNKGLSLVLALSYSSRWEIIQAVKAIALKIEQGEIQAKNIDKCIFEQYLNTQNFPDPELLIRTSGEYRLSNFLLWQIAYTELYFTNTLWPDFRREHLFEAILDYQCRERRFGQTSEQMSESINVNS
ncbi:MAG: isoprenyl transferase [Bacteroidales bacterium]|nr:isoprenyl transferase [Bacteroidales bacterium]